MHVSRAASTSPTWPTSTAATTSGLPVPSTSTDSSVINNFDYLTDSDRELIFQVTGERYEPGAHTNTEGFVSIFADQIGMDRRLGNLGPGQDVTASYLRDVTRRYANAGVASPFSAEVMDKALLYLRGKGRSTDVHA